MGSILGDRNDLVGSSDQLASHRALDHDLGVPAHVGRRCALPLQVDHGRQPADLLNLPGLLEHIDNSQAVVRPPLARQPSDCRVDRLVLGAVEVRRLQIGLDPLDRAIVRHQRAKQVLLDLDCEMLAAHACTLSRRYWPSFTFAQFSRFSIHSKLTGQSKRHSSRT